ncbi:unnamed protein product, partial [Amoebophrya sp. A25]|eukprot:GSA25T00024585001.1
MLRGSARRPQRIRGDDAAFAWTDDGSFAVGLAALSYSCSRDECGWPLWSSHFDSCSDLEKTTPVVTATW